MKRFGLTALLSLFLVGVSCPLWAKVVYVSPNGNDLNNGLSWATAKRTVTAALQTALPGDQVWVRYGVYVERITLKNGVSLYGGFRGNETSLSQRPPFPRSSPDPYETVLDGNQQGSVVTSPDTANRAYRLDGFTIRNGKAENGGGMYLTAFASYLTVENCTITYNHANSTGGGVFCYNNCGPTVIRCFIVNNVAHQGGGVCCDYNSSPTLVNCTIASNRAYRGGGVCCDRNSSPTLTNCTVALNHAGGDGGGVRSYSALTMIGCIVAQNSAGGCGGGVCCESSANLLSCIIALNTSHDGGGVWGSPTLTNCTIAYNGANREGGGVWGWGSPTLTNCTIVGNRAGEGGGIWIYTSQTKVRNTLIAQNLGGGIRSPMPNEFRHNCVWGNIPCNFAGGIGNPIGSNGNISVDPLLAAGHLLPGSPCINRGDNSVVTVDTDIDGETRIAGDTVDIGADEFHAPIVHGYLLFNDFVGNLPPIVDWEIRAGSAEVRPLLIDIDGAFVVPRVPSGRFALSVKPLSYLRRTVAVDTSRGSVQDLVISLTNGDIDGDNEVTLFDFGRLVAAFGSSPDDTNWDLRADLDGDNEVTLFDFGVLVRNFGAIGDD